MCLPLTLTVSLQSLLLPSYIIEDTGVQRLQLALDLVNFSEMSISTRRYAKPEHSDEVLLLRTRHCPVGKRACGSVSIAASTAVQVLLSSTHRIPIYNSQLAAVCLRAAAAGQRQWPASIEACFERMHSSTQCANMHLDTCTFRGC